MHHPNNYIFVHHFMQQRCTYGTDKDIYIMVYRSDSKPYSAVFIDRLCNGMRHLYIY